MSVGGRRRAGRMLVVVLIGLLLGALLSELAMRFMPDSTARTFFTTSVAAAFGPRPGAYTGFLGDEGEGRVRAAYPGATWERLAAIKARVDPGNLFRSTQNVPPAASGEEETSSAA